MKMQNYYTVQIDAAVKTQWGECTCITIQIKKNTHYVSSKAVGIRKLVRIKKIFFMIF